MPIKMSGAGNSFVLIDEDKRQLSISRQNLPAWGKRGDWVRGFLLSQERDVKKKTDGFFFFKKEGLKKVIWDFYNRDGSQAEMCGNAARCMGKYYFDREPQWKEISLQTLAGVVVLHRDGLDKIRVQMPSIVVYEREHGILWKEKKIRGLWVNTGVPHFVINEEQHREDFELAFFCRNSESFKPNGANVTFFKKQEKNKIKSISFERGVENFTLACGTGAVAAAVAYKQSLEPNVKLKEVLVCLPGGEVEVVFREERIEMVGSAQYEDKEGGEWNLK